MGLFDKISKTLFGGGEQKSQQTIYGPQADELKKYYGAAGDFYSQNKGNPQSLVAGQTPWQTQGQGMAANYAQSLPQFAGQTSSALQRLIGGSGSPEIQDSYFNSANIPTDTLNQMMSGQVNMDPYNNVFDAAAGRMTRSFTEDVLPTLRRDNVGSSSFGSTRRDIGTGIASDRLQQNLGDLASNIYGGAYGKAQDLMGQGANIATNAGINQSGLSTQAGLDRAGLANNLFGMQQQGLSQGIGMAPEVAALGAMPAEIMMQLGNQEQARNQQMLNAPLDLLGKYQGLLGNANTLSSSSGNTRAGIIPGLSGAGEAGAGLMTLFSDVRLKRDIKYKETINGINIYQYKYLWSDQEYIGVMAQEIESIIPDAVHQIGEYKAVDYEKVRKWVH